MTQHFATAVLLATGVAVVAVGPPAAGQTPTAKMSKIIRAGDAVAGTTFLNEYFEPNNHWSTEPVVFRSVLQGFINVIARKNGTSTTIVLRQGNAPPNEPPGVVFNAFDTCRSDAAGNFVTLATVSGRGTTNSNDAGVWRCRNGSTDTVMRKGAAAPGLPGGVIFKGASTNARPAMNAAGVVVFRGDLLGPGITSDNDSCLWRWIEGVSTPIAREGDAAAGTRATFESLFDRFDIDEDGAAYFYAAVDMDGSPSGIWRVTAGSTTPSPIIVPGQPAPGLVRGETVKTATLSQVSSNGCVALIAELAGPTVSASNDASVWYWNGSELTLIAREGDAVPAPEVGRTWHNLLGTAALSRNGRMSFVANTVGATGEEEAWWLVTSRGPIKVFRAGDPGVGSTPPPVLPSLGSNECAVAINDNGDVVFGSNGSLFAWREGLGLIAVGIAGSSIVVDGVTTPLYSTYLPAPVTSAGSSSATPSWSLDDDGRFLVYATYNLGGSNTPKAILRGTLPKMADTNGDGGVNVTDLLRVISDWGPCPSCAADCTKDGVTNVSDLLLVISQWGS